MNNIIDFYEFQRHRKMKKFLRFILIIGAISIFFVFAYLLIVTEIHHPTEYPAYIEAKP
jgi:hypothetical protein